MAFDPDAFVSEEKPDTPAGKPFDPDAFLSEEPSPDKPGVSAAGAPQPLPSNAAAGSPPEPSADQTPALRRLSPDEMHRLDVGSGGVEQPGDVQSQPGEPDLEPWTPQREGEQRAALLEYRANNGGMDPTRSADVLKYAAASGLPPEMVEANLDGVKQQVEAKGTDWKELSRLHPALADFLAANPHVQAAATKDLPELKKLSTLAQMGQILLPSMTGEQLSGLLHEQEDYNQKASTRLWNLAGPLGVVTNLLASPIAQHIKREIIEPTQALAVQDVEARAAQVTGPLEAGLGLEPTNLLGEPTNKPDPYGRALIKAATGSDAVGATAEDITRKFMSGVWVGIPGTPIGITPAGRHAFDSMDLDELRDAQDSIVKTYGQWGAEGLDTAFGLVSMLAGGGGGGGLSESGAKAAEDVATRAGLGPVTSKLSKLVGETFGAGLEGLGFGLGQAATEPEAGESQEQVAETMGTNMLFAGALHHVMGVGGRLLHETFGPSRVSNADIAGNPETALTVAEGGQQGSLLANAILASELDTAAKAKLRTDAPEAFQKLIESVSPNAPGPSISAQAWTEYHQGARLNPLQEAARVMEDGGKAYSDAAATGGEFVIPKGLALKNFAGTPAAAELIGDLRAGPNLFTAKELELHQRAVSDALKEAAAERGTEFEEQKKAIHEAFRDAALGTGKVGDVQANYFGRLMSNAAGSLALRTGVSVGEAARMANFHDLRLLGPEGEAKLQQSFEQMARTMGAPTATRALEARAATMLPEQIAREAYIDKNTGLPNERAAKETPAPENKPLTAHVSVEGTKYVNDTFGHDAGDLLYRSAARALSSAEPTDLARRGGDFTLHVKNEAELRDILDRANASGETKGFKLTGAAGDTWEKAEAAHIAQKETAEKEGTRAERGKLPLGMAESATAPEFGEQKAVSVVPEALERQVMGKGTKARVEHAYVEPESGVLNNAGWNALPRKAHQATIDIKSFKEFNARFGREAGDRALVELGIISRKIGGSSFDFAHLHGDEYALQHDDPTVLEAHLKKLVKVAHDVGVDLTKDGKDINIPLEIRYGHGALGAEGKSLEHAESDLLRRKAAEQPGGGIEPRLASEATLGRGAQPQGFGGPEEAARQDALAAKLTVAHAEGQPFTLEQGGKYDAEAGEPEFAPEEPGAKPPPRGRLTFGADETGRPNHFKLQLLATADKSTLFHEASHFLSWSLHSVAESAIATPELKADYQTLLKYAGYDSPEARLAELADKSRAKETAAKEERISHGFEQYIEEGKAPNKGLARVFSTMRKWMLALYKGMGGAARQYEHDYGQPLQLSDEVRGVFARLLGQDAALKEAESETGGQEDNPAAMAKMSPAELKRYRQLGRDGTAEAEQAVAAGAAERQKAIDGDRRRILQEVGAEVDARPEYAAAKALGIPAEQLAEQTGGPPVKPREQAVAEEAQRRITAKYGPAIEAQTKEALGAVHNDADLERAVMEHRALSREVDPATERRANALDPKLLKSEVRRMVGERTVEQLDEAPYVRAERRLALQAAELQGKGDEAGAAEARQKRILNKMLAMEVRDTRAELDKARQRMVDPPDKVRAQLGKADPAYRDAHDAILANARLSESEPTQDTASLEGALQAAQAAGQGMDFDANGIRKLFMQPKAWESSLTVDEARNVAGAVENLKRAARNQLEMMRVRQGQEREALKSELIQRAEQRPKQPVRGEQRDNEGAGTKLRLMGQAFDAALTDPRTFAEMLDGGKEGPWHDVLVNSRTDARDTGVELTKKIQAKLQGLWDAMPSDVRGSINDHVELDGLPPLDGFKDNRTRSTLYMMFLNWGNEGNRQRLADGRGWERRNIEKALQQIRPEEANFLQGVLDSIQGLYKPMADVHERETGLRPEQVEPAPIVINGKEYAGGYFPAKYDYRGSELGGRQLREEAQSVQDIFSDAYQRPSISASFAKARADAVTQPLDLSWSNVLSHISQVIHDISHREYVKDVANILLDPDIRRTLQERLGVEREKQFIPWLQAVANQRADSIPAQLSTMQRTLGWLGSKFAIQSVGWSFRSAAGLLTDSIQPVINRDVSGARMMWSAIKMWNPITFGDMREQALALSPELRYRELHGDNNLAGALKEFGKPSSVLKKISDTAFFFHSVVDKRTATLLFDAKYNQGRAEGLSQADAVRAADDVVAKSLPSVDIGEKPGILRDKRGFSGFITFYGYANKIWNMNRRGFDAMYRVVTGEDSTKLEKGAALAKFSGMLLARAAVPGILGALLRGNGPDDNEDPAEWAARAALMENIDTVPLFATPVSMALEGRKPEFRLPPQLAMMQGMTDRLWNMAHGAQSEDDDAQFWRTVETLGGFATGTPTAQLHSTLDYLQKLDSGETEPRGPGDVLGGVFYGERKAKPANPFTAAQSLVSGSE